MTLREKVYNYLREGLATGRLEPGSYINQDEICANLNISRAPLRDALIQLDTEQFVQIQPRRGVLIKPLTLRDVQNSYEIAGFLESAVVKTEFTRITKARVAKMKRLNDRLHETLEAGKYDAYYQLNLNFHDIFLSLSGNQLLKTILMPIKQRLYDFPRMNYQREWEKINLLEHERFIYSIETGNREAAVSIIINEHWSFTRHREYLEQVYCHAQK